MAKVSELKEMIVDLKVELRESQLQDGHCPYKVFGNPFDKEIDCTKMECRECEEEYFEDYRNRIKKWVRKL